MSPHEESLYIEDWRRVARQDWHRKKTHTLHSLLDDAVAFESRLAPFRPACERISGFYFAERYPSVGGEGVLTEDVELVLPVVRELIGLLFPDEVLES